MTIKTGPGKPPALGKKKATKKKAAKKPATKKAASKKAPAKKAANDGVIPGPGSAKRDTSKAAKPAAKPAATPKGIDTNPQTMSEKQARTNLARLYQLQENVDRMRDRADAAKQKHDAAKTQLKEAEDELFTELHEQKEGPGPLFEDK